MLDGPWSAVGTGQGGSEGDGISRSAGGGGGKNEDGSFSTGADDKPFAATQPPAIRTAAPSLRSSGSLGGTMVSSAMQKLSLREGRSPVDGSREPATPPTSRFASNFFPPSSRPSQPLRPSAEPFKASSPSLRTPSHTPSAPFRSPSTLNPAASAFSVSSSLTSGASSSLPATAAVFDAGTQPSQTNDGQCTQALHSPSPSTFFNPFDLDVPDIFPSEPLDAFFAPADNMHRAVLSHPGTDAASATSRAEDGDAGGTLTGLSECEKDRIAARLERPKGSKAVEIKKPPPPASPSSSKEGLFPSTAYTFSPTLPDFKPRLPLSASSPCPSSPSTYGTPLATSGRLSPALSEAGAGAAGAAAASPCAIPPAPPAVTTVDQTTEPPKPAAATSAISVQHPLTPPPTPGGSEQPSPLRSPPNSPPPPSQAGKKAPLLSPKPDEPGDKPLEEASTARPGTPCEAFVEVAGAEIKVEEIRVAPLVEGADETNETDEGSQSRAANEQGGPSREEARVGKVKVDQHVPAPSSAFTDFLHSDFASSSSSPQQLSSPFSTGSSLPPSPVIRSDALVFPGNGQVYGPGPPPSQYRPGFSPFAPSSPLFSPKLSPSAAPFLHAGSPFFPNGEPLFPASSSTIAVPHPHARQFLPPLVDPRAEVVVLRGLVNDALAQKGILAHKVDKLLRIHGADRENVDRAAGAAERAAAELETAQRRIQRMEQDVRAAKARERDMVGQLDRLRHDVRRKDEALAGARRLAADHERALADARKQQQTTAALDLQDRLAQAEKRALAAEQECEAEKRRAREWAQERHEHHQTALAEARQQQQAAAQLQMSAADERARSAEERLATEGRRAADAQRQHENALEEQKAKLLRSFSVEKAAIEAKAKKSEEADEVWVARVKALKEELAAEKQRASHEKTVNSATVSALQSRLPRLETTVEQLRHEKADLETKLATMTRDRDAQLCRLQESLYELVALDDEVDYIRKSLTGAAAEASALAEDVSCVVEHFATSRSALTAAVDDEKKRGEAARAELRAKVAAGMRQQATRIDELEAQLKAEGSLSSQELEGLQVQLAAANSLVDLKEKEKDAAEAGRKTAEAQVQLFARQLETKKKEAEGLQGLMKAKIKETGEVKMAKDRLDVKAGELLRALADRDAKFAEFEKTCATHIDEVLAETSGQLEANKRRIEQLERELEEAKRAPTSSVSRFLRSSGTSSSATSSVRGGPTGGK
ncbi:hypothetical protein JCM10213v2_008878 [Rhodosporidiobolus nylandii]